MRVRKGGWLLAAVALTGCGGSVELQSKWLDRAIDVDGVLYEWTDNFLILYKHDIDVGVFNDDEFLYLSFGSGSHEVQTQIDERGLFVWFDSSGEKKRDFGVKFPLGWQSLVELPEDEEMPAELPEDLIQARDAARETALTEMEFLVEGQPAFRVGAGTTSGVEASVRSAGAALSYELKIPLRPTADFPYAVGVEPGGKLMLGFETLESKHRPPPPAEPMRRPTGTDPLPGTIETPPPPPESFEERLQVWLLVQLAPAH